MDRNFSRGHAVEKFAEVCREVLSESERLGLHKLLSDYHRRRRVERLVPGLFKVVHEENRMEIVHLLRQLIPYAHLSEFDRQIHQRRARGQLKTFFWEDTDDGIGTTISFNSGVYHNLMLYNNRQMCIIINIVFYINRQLKCFILIAKPFLVY
jgi:hypothetical protein